MNQQITLTLGDVIRLKNPSGVWKVVAVKGDSSPIAVLDMVAKDSGQAVASGTRETEIPATAINFTRITRESLDSRINQLSTNFKENLINLYHIQDAL
mgnify:CR=1 FL=1